MAVEHLPRLSSVASLVCWLNDDASAVSAGGVEKAVFVSGWIREEDTVSLLQHSRALRSLLRTFSHQQLLLTNLTDIDVPPRFFKMPLET